MLDLVRFEANVVEETVRAARLVRFGAFEVDLRAGELRKDGAKLKLTGQPFQGRLYLSGFDAYYVGLLFYGLASTACSYLFFKSGYIPRGLAAFGVIVSGWAAVCTIAFIISPDFATLVNLWWFDTGLGLFELATGFWLVIKGLRPEMTTADRARAGITA